MPRLSIHAIIQTNTPFRHPRHTHILPFSSTNSAPYRFTPAPNPLATLSPATTATTPSKQLPTTYATIIAGLSSLSAASAPAANVLNVVNPPQNPVDNASAARGCSSCARERPCVNPSANDPATFTMHTREREAVNVAGLRVHM